MVARRQSWRSLLDEVATDNLSGARGVTVSCVAVLLAYARQSGPSGVDEVRADLRDLSRKLLSAHPAMAPVANLLNAVWQATGRAGDVSSALSAIEWAARGFAETLEGTGERVARRAADVLESGMGVLTISASSTVEEALLHAHRQGTGLTVLCLESRPMLEGRALAERLSAAGLPVTLGVDAAANQLLERADVVLFGVDCLAAEGVVAKIGTAGLALAANRAGVPVYALADRSKIWPQALGRLLVNDRPGDEVWAQAPEGIALHNRYFDLTDWSLIGGVILEDELASRHEVVSVAETMPVHDALAALYERLRAT